MNVPQAARSNANTELTGSLESRTKNEVGCSATSTQALVAHALLLRHSNDAP